MTKTTNVMVEVLANGEVQVYGVKKNGERSAVNYTVVETKGLREYGKTMMEAGVMKQYKAMTEEVASQPTPKAEPKQEQPKQQQPVSATKGKAFTNIKRVAGRAVQFDVVGKGTVTVGFARDRNAFLESFGDTVKEVNRADVLRRMSKYQGEDARQLVKLIKELKPVTQSADVCGQCGCAISSAVREYSNRVHGKVLCFTCQKGKPEAERSEAEVTVKVATEVLSTEETTKAYFEETCGCGAVKERAYELCEECRAQQWAEGDNNQTTLTFETNRTNELCACGQDVVSVGDLCLTCLDEHEELIKDAFVDVSDGASETSAKDLPVSKQGGGHAAKLTMEDMNELAFMANPGL